jgi:DnaK suppressor protein
MEDISQIRSQLEASLRAIFDRNDEVRNAMRQRDPGGNWSYEDLGIEGEFDDVLDSLGEISRKELLQIWNAIQRIDRGDYGNCRECGRGIDSERLRAIPWAEFCYDCAAKLESS